MLGQTTLPQATEELLSSESRRLWREAEAPADNGRVAIDLQPAYWPGFPR